MSAVSFLTGNHIKWAIARDVFAQYGVEVVQARLDVPEIQSLDVAAVASFSATYGCEKLGTSVFKSDVGYYIEALGGFPGPLVKFINQSLTAQNLLSLMSGQTNRRVLIRDCLAFKQPGRDVKTFSYEYGAEFQDTASEGGTPINQVLVINGFDKTIGSCTADELHQFWVSNLSHYHELAKYVVAT